MNIRLTPAILEELQRLALAESVKEYWIKACRGRLAVEILNPLEGQRQYIILDGDTHDPDVDVSQMTVPLYADEDAAFFRQANRTLINEGLIVPFTKELATQMSDNAVTDDELVEALGKKFFAVKAYLDKFTSPTPCERMLRLAKEMNSTMGVVSAIENRLAELQALDHITLSEE